MAKLAGGVRLTRSDITKGSLPTECSDRLLSKKAEKAEDVTAAGCWSRGLDTASKWDFCGKEEDEDEEVLLLKKFSAGCLPHDGENIALSLPAIALVQHPFIPNPLSHTLLLSSPPHSLTFKVNGSWSCKD